MKYIAKILLSGDDEIHESRNYDQRECKDAWAVSKYVDEIVDKGFEYKFKKQIRDYNKIIRVDLYFKHKNK